MSRSLMTTRVIFAAAFAGAVAILGGAIWQSYETAQREASVFASLAATAFQHGFCDRA